MGLKERNISVSLKKSFRSLFANLVQCLPDFCFISLPLTALSGTTPVRARTYAVRHESVVMPLISADSVERVSISTA